MVSSRTYFLIAIFILVSLVTACQGEIPGFEPTDTPQPTASQTPTPTETPTPTATQLPPVGVFLTPPEADPELSRQIQALISQRIPDMGLRFQVLPSITAADLARDDYRWVVALPPQPDFGALVASAPEVRFLAVGIDGLEPAPNLSTVNLDADQEPLQAFMAGYTGTLITPDWRVGMIGLKTPAGEAARLAFKQGALFICASPSTSGQNLYCRPTYAPLYEYPLFVELEPDATEQEWQAVAQFLVTHAVETIYVMPGAGGEGLLRYLTQSGVNIIGAEVPPEGISENWVVSFRSVLMDGFEQVWTAFVAGEDGQTLVLPIALMDINSDLLSPGRQRLVEEMLTNVLAGYIDIGAQNGEGSLDD